MIRKTLLTVAALILLLTFAGCGDDGDSDAGDAPDTLTLYSNEFNVAIPPGEKEIGDGNASDPGASIAFWRPLYDSDQFDNEVGRHDGTATVTQNEGGTIHQYGASHVELQDGSIEFTGDYDVSAKTGEAVDPSITNAITGGTGSYEGVGGTVTLASQGDDIDVLTFEFDD
jgi:hypothetical protein